MSNSNNLHPDFGRERSPRLNLIRLHKRYRSSISSHDDRSNPGSPIRSRQPSPLRILSIPGLPDSLPDETILESFSQLYESVVTYVKTFCTAGPTEGNGASQIMIEQASIGILTPWPQILDLLGDPETRLGVLAMCIAGTMLSRSLLLRLGISNSPGATFLPPEVVDCFQSFCIGKSAMTLNGHEPDPVNFALLSRWKQISATLLHSTSVENAFSPFDSRTVNIERAMKDLDPLLAAYAIPEDAGHGEGARLEQLRHVLRKGAAFAFMLFGQPCLWKFDWYSNLQSETGEDQMEQQRPHENDHKNSRKVPTSLTPAEIVVWPRLLRVMDQEGCRLEGEREGVVFGKKRFLNTFPND